MSKVLIVDDEEIVRQVLYRVLTKQGYEVETAQQGLEALEKIKSTPFDMVISDLKMPNMDGLTLIKKIKRINNTQGKDKDLPIIIVLTGYATVDTAKEALKLGCYDYITKPFEAEEISIIIKRALEAHRLAVEKQRLREQLVRAERLASLGQMAAGMAHEVNTALTSIRLFIEMLQAKIRDNGEVKNLSIILTEIDRAESLVKRFLDFAKPQDTEFRPVDINEIIQKSLEFLRYRFEKEKIEITKRFNEALPRVFCDPAKIEEVLLNLLANSIEAMPKGGRLNIKTEFLQGQAEVVISDTGCGIPKHNLDVIFDPFFTTKSEGWGLGLSIVHRIIDEHKGTISITSQEDKGTEVRIELPTMKSEVAFYGVERYKTNHARHKDTEIGL